MARRGRALPNKEQWACAFRLGRNGVPERVSDTYRSLSTEQYLNRVKNVFVDLQSVQSRRMKSPAWQPPPVGGGWAAHRLLGPFLLLTFLMLAASLIFLEDVRISIRQVLSDNGVQNSFPRPTISGSVLPSSAVRCNRIELPAAYYNDSQGPYNPAAIRHTITGEWLLVYTYDEVSLCLRGFPTIRDSRPVNA